MVPISISTSECPNKPVKTILLEDQTTSVTLENIKPDSWCKVRIFIGPLPTELYCFWLSIHMSVCQAVCGHPNLVIYHQISSKFHVWIRFIKLSPKFKYALNPMINDKACHQNCHHLLVYSCGHSNLVIYHLISSEFDIWTTFIKLSPMLQHGFCQTNNNHDGHQNGL